MSVLYPVLSTATVLIMRNSHTSPHNHTDDPGGDRGVVAVHYRAGTAGFKTAPGREPVRRQQVHRYDVFLTGVTK